MYSLQPSMLSIFCFRKVELYKNWKKLIKSCTYSMCRWLHLNWFTPKRVFNLIYMMLIVAVDNIQWRTVPMDKIYNWGVFISHSKLCWWTDQVSFIYRLANKFWLGCSNVCVFYSFVSQPRSCLDVPAKLLLLWCI